MLRVIEEATEFIKSKSKNFNPEAGIVLGSGLGGFGAEMDVKFTLDYHDIPHFPVSTVKGHKGQLLLGEVGGKRVVCMQGRFHFYEGYTLQQVTFPIRVMKLLGIKYLFLSNASGGVNLNFKVGDLMILEDHINLLPGNPLIGENLEKFGTRFPDMSEPYDKELIAKAKKIAVEENFELRSGVYAAVSGPSFETQAEYKYIRAIGADTVGMSTVPEVIVARHMHIPCFAVSVITDLGGHDIVQEVTHEEVLEVASAAEKKLSLLIKKIISGL